MFFAVFFFCCNLCTTCPRNHFKLTQKPGAFTTTQSRADKFLIRLENRTETFSTRHYINSTKRPLRRTWKSIARKPIRVNMSAISQRPEQRKRGRPQTRCRLPQDLRDKPHVYKVNPVYFRKISKPLGNNGEARRRNNGGNAGRRPYQHRTPCMLM